MSTTHAQWWLDQFSTGTVDPGELYAGADIVQSKGSADVLLYCDGSRITVPEDGEAVAS